MNTEERLPSSFRDPSGFVYKENGKIFRQVNRVYQTEYDLLNSSGLYKKLVSRGMLIPHEELQTPMENGGYKVIQPQTIPFISYPYEWSFSQLRDAALLTLAVQKAAFEHDMVLRDASAFNVQFLGSKPIFIDTLSFGLYEVGSPWIAYRQFCQHFLAPLALVSARGPEMTRLLQTYIDGLPLAVVAELMPGSSFLNPGLLMHLKMHAQSQDKYADKAKNLQSQKEGMKMPREGFAGLIDNLEWTIKSLKQPRGKDVWFGYEGDNNYTEAAAVSKKSLVEKFLKVVPPSVVWDLGSNKGEFSRIAEKAGAYVVSVDGDPFCVDSNYHREKEKGGTQILPLVMDLSSPSPAIGWANAERPSFLQRGPADTALALALIHHLAIANNVPLPLCAQFFAQCARYMVIEFVPKGDSQVDRMLSFREDIFTDYNESGFEQAFTQYFSLIEKIPVEDSRRTLYFFGPKSA